MPRWEVQSVGVFKGEDDGDYIDRVVTADDVESAAEDAVAGWWNEDPGGTLPEGMLVKVRPAGGPDEASWEWFEVTGNPAIDWTVRDGPRTVPEIPPG